MAISPEYVLNMSDVLINEDQKNVWPLIARRHDRVYTQSYFLDSVDEQDIVRELLTGEEHSKLVGPSLDIMHYKETGEIRERLRPGMTMLWLENPWLMKGETNG